MDRYHAMELITVTGDNQSYEAVKMWNTEPEQNVAFHTAFYNIPFSEKTLRPGSLIGLT